MLRLLPLSVLCCCLLLCSLTRKYTMSRNSKIRPIVYCSKSEPRTSRKRSPHEFQNKFAKLGVWRVWKDSPHFWYLIWDFNPPILTYLWNNFLFHSCVSEIFRIERWDRKYLSTKKKFEIRISSNSNFVKFVFFFWDINARILTYLWNLFD